MKKTELWPPARPPTDSEELTPSELLAEMRRAWPDAALGEARGTASASESLNSEQGALRASLDGTAGHTPGKWEVERIDGEVRIYSAEDACIADLTPAFDTIEDEAEVEANAKLIAAAPDLLRENARLREQLEDCANGHTSLTEMHAELTRARTAHLENATLLAKANARAATMEAAIRWALGELPSRDGRWFDSSRFGWREGIRVPPFWWRPFLRLFSEVDFALADRKGNAAQPPLSSDPAAGRAEGKKP